MEPLKFNVSDVIGKWSSHNSASAPLREKDLNLSKADLEVGSHFSNIQRRRNIALRKGQKRDKQALEIERVLQNQNKFSLTAPVLKNPIKDYQVHICKKCQNLLEYVNTNAQKISLRSQTKDLTRFIKTNSSHSTLKLSWVLPITSSKKYLAAHLFCNITSQHNAVCFESSDQALLKSMRQNDRPIIFVSDSEDIFKTILFHCYLLFIDSNSPVSVIEEDAVSSPVLRYLLQKIGFIIIDSKKTEYCAEETAESLLDHLDKNGSIVVHKRPYSFSSQPPTNIIDCILDRQRKNDKRLDRTLLTTTAISLEGEPVIENLSSFSLFPTFSNPNQSFGLIHINISHFVKLKSLVRVASELNQQNEIDEENNLIARHINFDMLETKRIMPVNIVSSILLTKYRAKEKVVLSDFTTVVDDMITKFQEMQKNLGFLGTTENIVEHAFSILRQQDVITFDDVNMCYCPNMSNIDKTKILFDHSLNIIHTFIPRAIIASSIISLCGGETILRQGKTNDMSFVGSKVLERAEFLAEIISFLLDFHCPFNEMADTLTSTLDHFVAMGYIRIKEAGYLDSFHQRLAYSTSLNCAIGEEDVLDGQKNEIIYEIVSDKDNDIYEVLYDYSSYIVPFVELCFVLLAIIREEKSQGEFLATELYQSLHERYDENFFKYAELVQMEFVSRFCDHLFEMGLIDDVDEAYALAEKYRENDCEEVLLYLQRISNFR